MPSCLENFLNEWQQNNQYFGMLRLLAGLSRLFSENEVPYLDYRIAENVFCKYYSAKNEARHCHSFDAKLENFGIGIKTFVLKNDSSVEKIAEFDKLKSELDLLNGLDLATKLAEFRNRRIEAAEGILNVKEKLYHIVGRQKNLLKVFNFPYELIDIENIRIVDNLPNGNIVRFQDGKNSYQFNRSKSVLEQEFSCPRIYKDVEVDIIADPYEFLEECFKEKLFPTTANEEEYIILPLYSTRTKKKKIVPNKSGLNQWNAKGRGRDENEVYIPVPQPIHKRHPNFFPKGSFKLELPNGSVLSARLCQGKLDKKKGLMSNPNKDLGKWILRDVLKKKIGELVTMEDLDVLNIDSVKIARVSAEFFKITFSNDYESYEKFIS